MIMLCSHALLCFLVCIMWSSSVARGGRDSGTGAGMRGLISCIYLCKCPPYIHHQTIKITLQPSITWSPSHSQSLLCKPPWAVRLIGQGESKTDPSLRWEPETNDTPIRISLYHFALLSGHLWRDKMKRISSNNNNNRGQFSGFIQ